MTPRRGAAHPRKRHRLVQGRLPQDGGRFHQGGPTVEGDLARLGPGCGRGLGHDDQDSAVVLVASTSEVTNAAGAKQDPRNLPADRDGRPVTAGSSRYRKSSLCRDRKEIPLRREDDGRRDGTDAEEADGSRQITTDAEETADVESADGRRPRNRMATTPSPATKRRVAPLQPVTSRVTRLVAQGSLSVAGRYWLWLRWR